MYKLACMGDAASISGYAALGLETFAFEPAEIKKAGETLHRLAQNGYGVIYITGDCPLQRQTAAGYYFNSGRFRQHRKRAAECV